MGRLGHGAETENWLTREYGRPEAANEYINGYRSLIQLRVLDLRGAGGPPVQRVAAAEADVEGGDDSGVEEWAVEDVWEGASDAR